MTLNFSQRFSLALRKSAMNKQPTERKNLRALGLRIAFGLAVAGGVSGYWSFTMSGTSSSLQWWVGWLQDVGTEMLGAAVTILLVELVIYQKRDEASRIDRNRMRRREHFVDQLKSAQKQDKRQKILDYMKKQNLLSGAWLYEINLQGSSLQGCNLRETDLFEANLKAADLRSADLTDAILRKTNLRQANLSQANLQGSDLSEADLREANLSKASLLNANVDNAQLNAETRLPDGTLWQPGVTLEKFTQDMALEK